MKALLLSAYDARSHHLWREHIKALCPHIQWQELVLPARYFAWRVRGNSLTWAFNHRDILADNYDFLLCTSMTDLSALRGFAPQLAQIPNIVYFHENQFAYPVNPQTEGAVSVEPQILSIYTALCADEIVFNSEFNRASFLRGARALLKKLPDHVPQGLNHRLEKASVIPVPLAQELFSTPRPYKGEEKTLNIVWNHRWEFDKGPGLLLALVTVLIERHTRFRLHVLGQQFRQTPGPFETMLPLLKGYYEAHSITPGHWGYVQERSAYEAIVASADIALSTASHDFQGLALLEATALGCTPLAPDCMAYPEYLPAEHLYPVSKALSDTARQAADKIDHWATMKTQGKTLPRVEVSQFSPAHLADAYRGLFSRVTRQ
ncbi:MAG: DUF3524 domain-containing protein [Pseudohongiellaceae bacterium]|nr:DUF3524 domain-containing protein [Pseudohongiellaceae bacterium]